MAGLQHSHSLDSSIRRKPWTTDCKPLITISPGPIDSDVLLLTPLTTVKTDSDNNPHTQPHAILLAAKDEDEDEKLQTYKRLYEEFRKRPLREPEDFREWHEYLQGQLGAESNLKDYRSWTRTQVKLPQAPDTSLSAIAKSIHGANWKEGNHSMRHLNSVILNTCASISGSAKKVQDLGWKCGNFRVGLRLDGKPIKTPHTDSRTCEAYNVDLLVPWFVIGMRYSRVDNGGHRDVLVAPLGKLFFSPLNSESDDEWRKVWLTLVLEIRSDGTAGNMLIVDMDKNEPPRSGCEMDVSRIQPMLRGWPYFAVAQVEKTVGLVQTPVGSHLDVSEKLKVESTMSPQVVEVGEKLSTDVKGTMPIALFPLDGKRAEPE